MRSVGIFAPSGGSLYAALSDGLLRRRLSAAEQNPSCFGTNQADRRLAAVFLAGRSAASDHIAREYAAKGVPAILAGSPVFHSDQVRIAPYSTRGWVPDTGDESRLEHLGVSPARIAKDDSRSGVVMIGQANDTGLSDAALRAWYQSSADTIAAMVTGSLLWCANGAPWAPEGAEEATLTEALGQCRRAVTYSAHAATLALASGLIVVTGGPSVIGDLAGKMDNWARLRAATLLKVAEQCARIASSQWSLDEISTGEAFASLPKGLI